MEAPTLKPPKQTINCPFLICQNWVLKNSKCAPKRKSSSLKFLNCMLCHLYVVQQIIIALKVILLQLRLAAALCPALQLTLQGFCCALLSLRLIPLLSSGVLTGIPACRTPSFTPISAGRNPDPFRHLYATPHFFSIQNSTALGWDCL